MTPTQQNVVEMPRRGMHAFMFYIDDWRSSWQVQGMDDHEKMAYLNLLMKAASEPDCGIPDNDYELAVISGLGMRWFRKTRDRNKQIATEFDENRKPTKWRTAGEKLRECFAFRPENPQVSFCPNTEQSPDGRLYSEKLYKDFLYRERVAEKRRTNGNLGGRPRNGENEKTERLFSEGVLESKPKANGGATSNLQPIDTSSMGNPPPPPTPSCEEAVAAAPPTESAVIPDTDHQAITQRAIDLGMSVPSRSLTTDIRKKFAGKSIGECVQNLPRFPDQNSPGLWLHKSVQELVLETKRQHTQGNNNAPKKPTGLEKYEGLFEWAEERKAARRRNGG